LPKPSSTSLEDEFHIIAALEQTPTLSQRDLASVLGFSVGKVNYCLKALIDQGLIKAGRFAQNPNKVEYAYLLTPAGMASKAVLTAHFLERKMAQYEALKVEIASLQAQAALVKKPSRCDSPDKAGGAALESFD
jgi:EPS-associated MarR family transcriptional regulator